MENGFSLCNDREAISQSAKEQCLKKQLNTFKLGKAIENSRWSKVRLARRSGCSRQTIDNILRGMDSRLSIVASLASSLGLTVGYLLDEEEGTEGTKAAPTELEANVRESMLYDGDSKEEGYLRHISFLEELIREKGRIFNVLQMRYEDIARKLNQKKKALTMDE